MSAAIIWCDISLKVSTLFMINLVSSCFSRIRGSCREAILDRLFIIGLHVYLGATRSVPSVPLTASGGDSS